MDIVPQVTGSGWNIVGEPFGVICQRANAWINQFPGVRVTNIQSVNYKVSLSLWSEYDIENSNLRQILLIRYFTRDIFQRCHLVITSLGLLFGNLDYLML